MQRDVVAAGGIDGDRSRRPVVGRAAVAVQLADVGERAAVLAGRSLRPLITLRPLAGGRGERAVRIDAGCPVFARLPRGASGASGSCRTGIAFRPLWTLWPGCAYVSLRALQTLQPLLSLLVPGQLRLERRAMAHRVR